jgi:RNA polymerase sigma-70 factor (subfamily 1)
VAVSAPPDPLPASPPPASPPIEQLLEQHLDGLRAFLRLRAGAALRARLGHSDLVQSVCREVLAGRERFAFQGEAAFRGWLYTAALRKLVEHDRRLHAGVRDVRREVCLDADGGADAAVLQGYATATTPSMVAMGREGAAKLEQAFDELSEQHREIITLSRLAGLSHAEIGAQLGKSEENCRQLLRRALLKLALALERRGITL